MLRGTEMLVRRDFVEIPVSGELGAMMAAGLQTTGCRLQGVGRTDWSHGQQVASGGAAEQSPVR